MVSIIIGNYVVLFIFLPKKKKGADDRYSSSSDCSLSGIETFAFVRRSSSISVSKESIALILSLSQPCKCPISRRQFCSLGIFVSTELFDSVSSSDYF